jgi:hypothetical protein
MIGAIPLPNVIERRCGDMLALSRFEAPAYECVNLWIILRRCDDRRNGLRRGSRRSPKRRSFTIRPLHLAGGASVGSKPTPREQEAIKAYKAFVASREARKLSSRLKVTKAASGAFNIGIDHKVHSLDRCCLCRRSASPTSISPPGSKQEGRALPGLQRCIYSARRLRHGRRQFRACCQ